MVSPMRDPDPGWPVMAIMATVLVAPVVAQSR